MITFLIVLVLIIVVLGVAGVFSPKPKMVKMPPTTCTPTVRPAFSVAADAEYKKVPKLATKKVSVPKKKVLVRKNK